MNNDDLSTESLLARRALAEMATPGAWRVKCERHDNRCHEYLILTDGGDKIVGAEKIDPRAVYYRDLPTAICSLDSHDASHIAANNPDVVCATIDELLRLRVENAQLEREAESLRAVLQHAENWSMRIHKSCMDPTRPRQAIGEMAAALEKFIKEAEAAREGVEEKPCP